MGPYLDLLRDVRTHGVKKPTRAVLRSTGQKVEALSVFGRQIRFDLGQGFPLVTTKKVAFGAIVHELIWFLRGSTNVAYLRENNVTIWDEWADEEGELGPCLRQAVAVVAGGRWPFDRPDREPGRGHPRRERRPDRLGGPAADRLGLEPGRDRRHGASAVSHALPVQRHRAAGCRASSTSGRPTCSWASRSTSRATPC